MRELAHAQPQLFDTKHAWGRKLQTEKIAFDRYQLCLTNGDVCLQIGLSVKRSYWLKLRSLGISSSRFRQWTCWAFP